MAKVFSVGKRAGSMGVVRRILEDENQIHGLCADEWMVGGIRM
jgi:hypothetical protein